MGYVDRNQPVPFGLISVETGIDVHHPAVGIGYDVGPREEDVRVYVYPVPDPPRSQYLAQIDGGAIPEQRWRGYFVHDGYRPGVPPQHVSIQGNWRRCSQCTGLFFIATAPTAGARRGPRPERQRLTRTPRWCP